MGGQLAILGTCIMPSAAQTASPCPELLMLLPWCSAAGSVSSVPAGHVFVRLTRTGAAMVDAGMIGYSAYCPSKFAVRGLAECLRNEVSSQRTQVLATGLPEQQHAVCWNAIACIGL